MTASLALPPAHSVLDLIVRSWKLLHFCGFFCDFGCFAAVRFTFQPSFHQFTTSPSHPGTRPGSCKSSSLRHSHTLSSALPFARQKLHGRTVFRLTWLPGSRWKGGWSVCNQQR